MPRKIVVVKKNPDDRNAPNVVGAIYYDNQGFLSALAVLPEFRRQGIGKLLMAAAIGDLVRSLGVYEFSLFVLPCDASPELHKFYNARGFHGGNSGTGGSYRFSIAAGALAEQIEKKVTGEA